MISSKLTGLFNLIFLFWILLPVSAQALESQVEITHLVIKNTENALHVDLKIDSEFTPEMTAAVLTGVPVRFTFIISLYEVNDFWFDTKVGGHIAEPIGTP